MRPKAIIALLLTLLTAGFLIWVPSVSEGVQQPGDGILHYFISRYSWGNPHLLLSHWGKPLFTLLSSPFAQFGFLGMVVFNTIMFMATTWFILRTVKDVDQYWATPLIFLLSPVYFMMVIGGMTEVLFGAIVAATIHFMSRKEYTIAAVIFSFILFSRPEGQVIFPFFFLYLAWKSPKHLPFLLTGFVIYGLAGWGHYDTPLWFFTKSPYTGAKSIYGSGELLHFVKNIEYVIGNPLLYLLLAGTMAYFIVLARKIYMNQKKEALESFLFWGSLVALPALSILGVHSYLWWKGLKGSLGLVRVMATLLPFITLLILKGMGSIERIIHRIPLPSSAVKRSIPPLIMVLSLAFSYPPFIRRVNIPVPLTPLYRTVKKAGEWYRDMGHEGKVYYLHPYFAFTAMVDPYGGKAIKLYHVDKKDPSKGLEKGDMIVWDAHFGPNEGRLPLKRLKEDDELELIRSFEPNEEVIVLGGHEFAIHVFQKE